MIYYGSNIFFFQMGIAAALLAAGALLAFGTFVMKRRIKKWKREADTV